MTVTDHRSSARPPGRHPAGTPRGAAPGAPSTPATGSPGSPGSPGEQVRRSDESTVPMVVAGRPVGPLVHLAAERARLHALTFEHFTATPMGATIGAEIGGVDLSEDLDDAVVGELWRALLDFKVLCLRDQDLTPAGHVALARRFGDLEVHPFQISNPDHPELVRFHRSARVAGYENAWHSDVSWRERPSMGTILRAVQVPPSGGDTLFADMYAAYEGLDPALAERLEGLRALHDFSRLCAGIVSPGERAQLQRKFPPVEHPVVRRHPDTGRRLLYVNRFFVDRIVGMEPGESDALIDLLARQAELPEYQCRLHWADGTVAFWDNRAVQHYALSDYWPDVRITERASIVGDRPR